MTKEPIILTAEELEEIQKKCKVVGSGSEGTLYKVDRNTLFKIYHSSYNSPDDPKKLSREDALKKAIELQNDILYTRLPINTIYVDDNLIGCVTYYYRHVCSIYQAMRKNDKIKVEVVKKLLLKVKELLDHCIYHLDLCQRDRIFIFRRHLVNVLLNHNMDPIIIDLDGKSATYTDKPSLIYEQICVFGLAVLILEIMTGYDIQEDLIHEDADSIISFLKQYNFDQSFIDSFIDCNMSFDQLTEGFEVLSRKLTK